MQHALQQNFGRLQTDLRIFALLLKALLLQCSGRLRRPLPHLVGEPVVGAREAVTLQSSSQAAAAGPSLLWCAACSSSCRWQNAAAAAAARWLTASGYLRGGAGSAASRGECSRLLSLIRKTQEALEAEAPWSRAMVLPSAKVSARRPM